jgi:hypothetical protein
MGYTRMVRWFEHRVFSSMGRADRSIFGEAVRPELRTEPETQRQPRPHVDYDGPTVHPDANGRARGWIWVANGMQKPDRQFGPPRVLEHLRAEALELGKRRTSRTDLVIESFRAEALEIDIYDPLTDEAPDCGTKVADDAIRGVAGTGGVAGTEPCDDSDGQDSGLIEVRILGPVEVSGWRHAPERSVLTELVCYLALHRDRAITGESIRAALRPEELDKEQSAKTLRTYLSLLRKSLGAEVLPNATSAGYQLAGAVDTDWDRFRHLSVVGDLQSKLEALKLIRGRPFEGVATDSYIWVFTEFWISDIEVAVIAQVKEAARLCREGRRSDDALFALRQGLLAVPSDFTLWDMYLAFSSEIGEAALRRARREAHAALGDDAQY